jgi:hypothetical protein
MVTAAATAPSRYATGNKEFHDFFAATLRSATREILEYVEPEGGSDPFDPPILEAFAEAAEAGIDIKVMIRKEDAKKVAEANKGRPSVERAAPHLGKNYNFKFVDKVHSPFTVIDGEKVVLHVRDPRRPEEYYSSVCIEDPAFAEEMRDLYFEVWNA